MQINFTQIFQDSLNFMRNQRKTVLLFVGIFIASQFINALVSVPMPSLGNNPDPSLQDIINALSKVDPTALIGSFVFQQLLMSFIAPSVLQLFIILVSKIKIRLIKVSC